MYDVISNPIGLGRNDFFIDQSFLLKASFDIKCLPFLAKLKFSYGSFKNTSFF